MSSQQDPGLFEIIHSTRAMRRLKTDPVPDELIEKILLAGVSAPSGGNRQDWCFLVVRDPEIKRAVQVYYKRALDEIALPHYRNSPPPEGVTKAQYERQLQAVIHLTEHFHEVPVWIVACSRDRSGSSRYEGASIYPAVQNMLLACRALGLGSTLTSRHAVFADECDRIFGLPEGIHSYAILPIGYPAGKFGPVRRRPLADVVFFDRYGQSSSQRPK